MPAPYLDKGPGGRARCVNCGNTADRGTCPMGHTFCYICFNRGRAWPDCIACEVEREKRSRRWWRRWI